MTEDLVKIAVPAVSGLLGLLGGVISARITARSKIRELQESSELAQAKQERDDIAKSQLQYFNPLRVAAMDLRDRLKDAYVRLARDDRLLRDTVKELEVKAREPLENFARWANGGLGQYAVSSMYMTVVYFARASRIRTELPFVKLSSDDDTELLRHLEKVRDALGGEYAIWKSSQDSLGSYLWGQNGTLANYREFCCQLADPLTGLWYQRVVDFFGDLHQKSATERDAVVAALDDLEEFLRHKPRETAQGIAVGTVSQRASSAIAQSSST